MKRNRSLLIVAALFFAACTASEPNAPEAVPGSKILISASREGCAASKTELQDDGSVLWSNGDKIKLVWNGGSAESEALSLSEPAATATFTVSVPDGVTPLYAVYPSSVPASYDGSRFEVTLPESADGSFAGAAFEVAEVPSEGIVALKNIGTLLSVEVASSEVTDIVVSAYGGKSITGKAGITFQDGLPVAEAVGEAGSSVSVAAHGAGVYYIPMLPASCTEGFHVLLKGGDTILGQKFTSKAFDFKRSKLYRLGTVAVSEISGLFVKVDGTGDGSSWDSAMGWSDLQNLIKNGSLTGNVYMAGGTYTIAADITVKAASNFSIFGGFNPASTGMDLSDRDIAAYVTAFDGGGTKRLFVYNNATSADTFDGVTFQNAYKSSGDVGSTLIFQNCKSATFNNCVIKNNKKEGAGGGNIRANKGVLTFTGCTFTGNTSAGNAAVFALTGATLTLDKCEFTDNTCSGSGSILYCVTSASVATLKDCYFAGNESGQKGVIAAGHPNGKILLNGCSFYKNVTGTGASCIYNKCMMAVNNCAFQENSNKAAEDASTIHNDSDGGATSGPGKLIVSNTCIRLAANSGAGVLTSASVNTRTLLVNNTIVNSNESADADKAVAVRTNSILTSYGHNVISKLYQVVEDSYVYEDLDTYPDAMDYKLVQTWNAEDRLIFWNSWNAEGAPDGFSLMAPSRLEAAYNAYDEAFGTTFKAQLQEIGGWDTDIRGEKRGRTYWPGSYDDGMNITL